MDVFTSAAGKTYEYTALKPNEVRLMVLHPGRPGHNSHRDQPLRCSLLTLTFDDAQRREYEALSYVCSASNLYGYSAQNYPEEVGKPNLEAPLPNECRIWCQHEVAEKSGFRNVTKNLIEGLSRLRYTSEDRVLWVDAMCINQDDNDAEKATQVPLMARIYSCASQVIIWLGETLSRPFTDVVLNRRDITESAFDYVTWVNKLEPKMRDLDFYRSTRPGDMLGTVNMMLAMFQELLWRCEWFQRTWTFQEAVMAKQATVICGGHQASWDALHEACRFNSRGMQLPSDILHHERIVNAIVLVLEVQRLRKLRCLPENTNRECLTNADPWRFDQLLHAIRSKNAACLHDKVYAVLSMASGQNLPRPDYSASLSKVYCDVAQCLSRNLERGWISVLSYAELPNRDIADELKELPSWAPNWSMPTDTAPISWYADFRAAGITVDNCFVLENKEGNQNPPLLSIRGARLFTVHTVAKASHEDKDELINMPWEPTESYPLTNEEYLVAYSKVARPDIMELTNPQEDPFRPCRSPFWEGLENFSARQLAKAGLEYHYDRSISGHRHYSHLRQSRPIPGRRVGFAPIHMDRRLFLGSSGCLGLAPLATRKGDYVCLFLGGEVLYVIRPVLNGHFTFVGECFVYGLMHGEAMEGLSEARVEDFILQ